MESGLVPDDKKLPVKGSEFIPLMGSTKQIKQINFKIYSFIMNLTIKVITRIIDYDCNYGSNFLSIKMMNDEYMSLIRLCAGDIELNPGPIDLTLLTQNCRGLKKKDKIKQMINRFHKLSGNSTKIIALQETHLEVTTLKYSWSGNLAVTPSVGSRGGVITLVSNNVNIVEQIDIDNEAHVLNTEIITDKDSSTYIIVNLHSPCAHDSIKLDFFEKITSTITSMTQNIDGYEIIILGDFNTTFNPSERNNTTRSKREISCARKISELLDVFNLLDCWDSNETAMTWRHGDKMSRIDRIKWSDTIETIHESTETDWTITSSDHAAVIVKLKSQEKKATRSKITRIDTTFIHNIDLRRKFIMGIDEKMEQLNDTNLNPNGKLEFLKMSIRSVSIEIAMNYRKEMEREFNDIKTNISFWQSTYENAKEQAYKELAEEKLDLAMAKRDQYLATRGKFLSERSRTKWYQEGEKSSKYFLNLNRVRNGLTEMSELLVDNVLIKEEEKIHKHVEEFYVKLYEKGDSKKGNKFRLKGFLEDMQEISKDEATTVITPITANDLFETLKTCMDSAPGPDGIPYSIIKLTWKHFGKLLEDSWAYAQTSGQLTHSHESSYLRLIPKEGKNISELKNWRPITLSNCDFKLITKTLSWRLAKAVEGVIDPHQTAYLKNRQISDNIHTMLHATEHSGRSMITSLDAEKAFDSLEHWYIKEVLAKIGLSEFNKTFDLMYRKQKVDIMLNGNKAGNYIIRNGVKQGDALSCILFILGVEPVLKKINGDGLIKNVVVHDYQIPKALAYADDIACITSTDQVSLQRIFNHYDALTSVSGLKLNANKTEIITKEGPMNFKVWYNDELVEIKTSENIKINGIILSYDFESARKTNIEQMIEATRAQLGGWCKRNLSILGKIQTFKTFGLSQLLYKLSVLCMNATEDKKLTEIIYKFIWNRNINVKKAPDRIKRTILLSKVENLGFGMLDYKSVVTSLRIRNLIRLLNQSNCPAALIIRSNISKSLFNLRIINPITECINGSIKLLRTKWHSLLTDDKYSSNQELLNLIQNEFVGNVINPKFKKNKEITKLRNDKIGDIIKVNNPQNVLKKLDKELSQFIESNYDSQRLIVTGEIEYCWYPIRDKLVHWSKVSSKLIRREESKLDLQIPKLLPKADPKGLKNLGTNISRLTNSRLKCILLRCLHGDIYCKERMFRFGMVEDNKCTRCGIEESISHMLMDCSYVKSLWDQISKITGIKITSLEEVLGLDPKHDKVTLTIHAETLRRLLAIERPVIEVRKVLVSIVKNLNILEKGVTKYQTGLMLKHIENNLT